MKAFARWRLIFCNYFICLHIISMVLHHGNDFITVSAIFIACFSPALNMFMIFFLLNMFLYEVKSIHSLLRSAKTSADCTNVSHIKITWEKIARRFILLNIFSIITPGRQTQKPKYAILSKNESIAIISCIERECYIYIKVKAKWKPSHYFHHSPLRCIDAKACLKFWQMRISCELVISCLSLCPT